MFGMASGSPSVPAFAASTEAGTALRSSPSTCVARLRASPQDEASLMMRPEVT